MRPSRKVQRKRRVNLTLLSAFFCFSSFAIDASANEGQKLLIAQQWQGQQTQGIPPAQWNSPPPTSAGQWGSPPGQGPPQGASNQYSGQYQNGAPGQWQGAPPQGGQQYAPPGNYAQQPGYSNPPPPNYAPPQGYPPPSNYAPPAASTPGQYAAPQYQMQNQNWSYQNQPMEGQATQSYAPPPLQQQQSAIPTPPANEGYPSVEELSETFNKNPTAAAPAEQPQESTAAKVGAGLLNMVKNSMMTPSYGMNGMGYPMGGMPMGGYGMPMGGYGMPYGSAPMGYPMMGSPGLMGAPFGMGSMNTNPMNNILNQGLRMFHF